MYFTTIKKIVPSPSRAQKKNSTVYSHNYLKGSKRYAIKINLNKFLIQCNSGNYRAFRAGRDHRIDCLCLHCTVSLLKIFNNFLIMANTRITHSVTWILLRRGLQCSLTYWLLTLNSKSSLVETNHIWFTVTQQSINSPDLFPFLIPLVSGPWQIVHFN